MADEPRHGDPGLLRAKLRDERVTQGLNQAEVARRVGIDDALVGHYETGERPFKEAHLRKWVKILGLPDGLVEDWLDYDEEERIVELMRKRHPDDVEFIRLALRRTRRK